VTFSYVYPMEETYGSGNGENEFEKSVVLRNRELPLLDRRLIQR